jgi:hypothetical protein
MIGPSNSRLEQENWKSFREIPMTSAEHIRD